MQLIFFFKYWLLHHSDVWCVSQLRYTMLYYQFNFSYNFNLHSSLTCLSLNIYVWEVKFSVTFSVSNDCCFSCKVLTPDAVHSNGNLYCLQQTISNVIVCLLHFFKVSKLWLFVFLCMIGFYCKINNISNFFEFYGFYELNNCFVNTKTIHINQVINMWWFQCVECKKDKNQISKKTLNFMFCKLFGFLDLICTTYFQILSQPNMSENLSFCALVHFVSPA
jgi:hypothetical protein